jgi:hypothetical protein
VKRQIATTLLPLSFAAVMAGAQTTADKAPSTAPQARDYWIDPATNLIWAAKDSGKDTSWKGAVKYCHGIDLAGFKDWRLANLDELQRIYDKALETPGTAGNKQHYRQFSWHIKGNIFLTGEQWTTLQRLDDRGKPSGYVYYFDFNDGQADNDPTGWPYSYVGRRALCVRGVEAIPNHTTMDFKPIKLEDVN